MPIFIYVCKFSSVVFILGVLQTVWGVECLVVVSDFYGVIKREILTWGGVVAF